ncbi:MAG: mRNA interferase HicA [Blastocatellia bacterium]|jgi:predicted RNA binding protein YcfA (HicA-like mRNA interferase family)|nr:mRNA interferase HicA [Blastocatellia bacterium]
MKRIDLVRHLEEFGCEFVREGKQHTLYINRLTRKSAAVPRHRDIPTGTVRSICRSLDIRFPSDKKV